ncbi:poly (ADP-ribose) glycohydrolase [Cryptosporidium ubiquitum]|uniref:poly(ADP-ribose) glycohydrolase n=1 Tax=Cryptosporidium ubiquitum TaxID=857276 RepID=A0A1J4ML95_9CRYT|nr:poly (ADP-ribose) glycohydrolase [Cryptosporidium ubiquitum]OII73645.1 poly (ADP-ribose) glycohydrolase [Cryptosporidium ubiquitum]
MNRIRYIFNEQGLWGSITSFISAKHTTVRSSATLRSFVKELGTATNDRNIISSTSSVASGIQAAFSNADSTQSSRFFSSTFSVLSQHLVKLTDNLTDNVLPIDIILPKANAIQMFTRKFIVLVIFAGFLGLFPNYIFHSRTPGLYFGNFFSGSGASGQQLSCILSYFNIMANKISSNDQLTLDLVVFERHYRHPSPESFFTSSTLNIQQTVLIKGFMETHNPGGHVVEAIFGNKVVGSAVLSNVMHQEEIMMTVAPETLISRIFHTDLNDEDVISFRGLMKFSKYNGYGSSFSYAPANEEDMYKPLTRVYGSIDALNKGYPQKQFTVQYALRELNKLLPLLCSDFYGESEEKHRSPFVTGYWGGGVFGGDIPYKFVIQLLGSCVCNRPMVYSDASNKLDLNQIRRLESKYMTCGELAKAFFQLQNAGRITFNNAIGELLK